LFNSFNNYTRHKWAFTRLQSIRLFFIFTLAQENFGFRGGGQLIGVWQSFETISLYRRRALTHSVVS